MPHSAVLRTQVLPNSTPVSYTHFGHHVSPRCTFTPVSASTLAQALQHPVHVYTQTHPSACEAVLLCMLLLRRCLPERLLHCAITCLYTPFVRHTSHMSPPPAPPQVIAHELEFISKQAKGQQAKGRARQRRYDELVAAANSYVKNTQVRPGTHTCPSSTQRACGICQPCMVPCTCA
jgi:hypothetical protein